MFFSTNTVIQNPDFSPFNGRYSYNKLGIKGYEGLDPSPQNYTLKNTLETKQHQYFRDAPTVSAVCGLLSKQAVEEFRDKFIKSPPPLYFKWWRNCWNEYEMTPDVVREWLEKYDHFGWYECLEIVVAQPIKGGAAA